MDHLGIGYFTSLAFTFFNVHVWAAALQVPGFMPTDILSMIMGQGGILVFSLLIGYTIYRRWDIKEKELSKLKDDIIDELKAEIEELKKQA